MAERGKKEPSLITRSKAKKTIRLENEIVKIAANVSSVAASKILRNQIADVGKSTICNLLKKRNINTR